jgi:hypothetical protein
MKERLLEGGTIGRRHRRIARRRYLHLAIDARRKRWLSYLGLEWPQCFDALPFSLATDLQREEPSADEMF